MMSLWLLPSISRQQHSNLRFETFWWGVPFTPAMLHLSLALWLYMCFLYKGGAGLNWRPGKFQEARFHLWALLSCCWNLCGARGGGRDAQALPVWVRAEGSVLTVLEVRTFLGPNSPVVKYSAQRSPWSQEATQKPAQDLNSPWLQGVSTPKVTEAINPR